MKKILGNILILGMCFFLGCSFSKNEESDNIVKNDSEEVSYMSFDEFLSIFNEENIDVDKYNKLYSKLSLITKPLTLEKIGEILNQLHNP